MFTSSIFFKWTGNFNLLYHLKKVKIKKNMKSVKIILKTILCVGLILLFSKSWQLSTDGFRLDKLKSSLTDKNIAIDKSLKIDEILDQKFKYLSKGCQTYVFVSEDNDYVIKFVRFHRYKIPLWLTVLDFFEAYKTKRQSYKDKLLKDSLQSYNIANNFLKDETATIYVHLNRTSCFNNKLEIKDRFHRKYLIDLDRSGFIIQKKVKTFENVLDINKHNEIELKRLASSFIDTTFSIYKKGFINDDYNCVKNSGIIDNRVIHTDLGSFLKKDEMVNKDIFKNEMIRFMRNFKKWSDKNAPFLSNYIDEEIKQKTVNL